MSHVDVQYPRRGRDTFAQQYYRGLRETAGRTGETLQGTLPSPCCLTEDDARLLEKAVAINGGVDTPIGRSVAEKLRHAELRQAIPEEYVTLNSDVIFRIDGRSPLNRVLVHWDEFFVPGLHLSLHTPWGMTLLGMKVGSEATVFWGDVVERIKVESASLEHAPAT